MVLLRILVVAAALSAVAWGFPAHAEKSTVCTITVNSPDEKEVFRRNLPEDQFQFVELVEHGRTDWLASACRKGIQCDVLVISGHFDAGTQFYSDRIEARESLAVEEMERVACSDSCPGLFSKLKEVHLYGCNTLNAEMGDSTAGEITRSLVRSGQALADAERLVQTLTQRYSESNRDAMRRIFANVPVIYGFSKLAPLGATAGPMLARYFQTAPAGEIGSGRASPALLRQFAGSSMTAASGLTEADPLTAYRGEACQFLDQRLSSAQKLDSVRQILARESAAMRMLFDRIEKFTDALTDSERQLPSVAAALQTIGTDADARERYLAYARATDRPEIRARMIRLADRLGWLSPAEQRAELSYLIRDQLALDSLNPADVDLICSLNRDHSLDGDLDRLDVSPARAGHAAQAAALACLGSASGHARTLQALTSADDREVQIAQVYVRHHPITDLNELRSVAVGVARMPSSEAQVRALDTLALHYVSDRESLEQLTELFPRAKSLPVQRALAGLFIRSDFQALPRPELIRVLQQYRVKSPDGADLIDALLRRLQRA
ncbi:MAG: hypothetical protein ABI831_18060 [Betaproteobacteria bacterium]